MQNVARMTALCREIKNFDKWNGLYPTFVCVEFARPVILKNLNSYEICHDSEEIGTVSKRQGFCNKVSNDFFYYYLYEQLSEAFEDNQDDEEEVEEADEITTKGKVDEFIQECEVKMNGQDEDLQQWKQDVLRNKAIEALLITREIWMFPVDIINEIINHL